MRLPGGGRILPDDSNGSSLVEWYNDLYNQCMPRVTTYSDARAHLKTYCDEVAEGGEPLIIKRRSGADVALVSLDELAGLEETAHLLRSPRGARRLMEALEEVRAGGGLVLSIEELREKYGLEG